MTLPTTEDADGETLNLGDFVEVHDTASGDPIGYAIDGEIMKVFKNGKMRIKPSQDLEPSIICTPSEVSLLYRGDS